MNKSEAPDECKSVLRGVFTRNEDNLIEVVRNLVNSWNDPNIRPEFICDVQRGLTYNKGEGSHNLFITATDSVSSSALISGAKRYLNPSNGIVWNPFSKARVCETYIEGLTPESSQNLTQEIKKLVLDWNDPEVDPNFIENVITQNIDGKEMLLVTATSAQNSRALVKGAKRHLTPESGINWFFTRRFGNN